MKEYKIEKKKVTLSLPTKLLEQLDKEMYYQNIEHRSQMIAIILTKYLNEKQVYVL